MALSSVHQLPTHETYRNRPFKTSQGRENRANRSLSKQLGTEKQERRIKAINCVY
jgi:hypothetical protein